MGVSRYPVSGRRIGMDVEQMASVRPAFDRLLGEFRGCFRREATFEHCRRYLLGLLSDEKRKNVEAMALAAGVAVRSMQEFLSQFAWDHERMNDTLQRLVADRHGGEGDVGVIDDSGHGKRGAKTPGVARQYCGELGKVDNCVVGVHLLWTDDDAANPTSAMLDSDLYLPAEWDEDAARRAEAGIPEEVFHRPKWQIAAEQVKRATGNGVRFAWLTFDEAYGRVPAFWFTLDGMGQRAIGEVPANFRVWATPPRYRSLHGAFRPSEARNLIGRSPAFTSQDWRTIEIKDTTRGPCRWRVKAARVQLPDTSTTPSTPTDRRYWLIVAKNPGSGETKYFLSNAPENAEPAEMLRAAFARWRVEKWFERAKQEVGFGDFEVRKYVALWRHWLCCRLAMYFLAAHTSELRGKKPTDHAGAGRPRGPSAAAEADQHLARLVA